MMPVPLLITLILAIIAIFISYSVTEEVESLGTRLLAFFCLILSLFLIPMFIKGIILVLLLFSYRVKNNKGKQSFAPTKIN